MSLIELASAAIRALSAEPVVLLNEGKSNQSDILGISSLLLMLCAA
jgi:hypothetical protein